MADIEKTAPTKERPSSASSDVQVHPVDSAEFNASGHSDQLPRQYGLLAICATALTIDNAWVVLGGSFVVAIANGGPPGVLYELLVACAYYFVVGACIAELASSIPSAGGGASRRTGLGVGCFIRCGKSDFTIYQHWYFCEVKQPCFMQDPT